MATIAKVYMKFAATVKGRLLFKAEIQYISMSISIKLKIRQPIITNSDESDKCLIAQERRLILLLNMYQNLLFLLQFLER